MVVQVSSDKINPIKLITNLARILEKDLPIFKKFNLFIEIVQSIDR